MHYDKTKQLEQNGVLDAPINFVIFGGCSFPKLCWRLLNLSIIGSVSCLVLFKDAPIRHVLDPRSQ